MKHLTTLSPRSGIGCLLSLACLTMIGLMIIQCKQVRDSDTSTEDPWSQADVMLERIHRPEFRDAMYPATDFGAVADGTTDALPAIRTAIDKCHHEGGGTVAFAPGTYFVKGPIHLRSNVRLDIQAGATLLFSNTPEDYLPVVLTRWEGVDCYNYSALIYAIDAENIAITGKGTLNGQADSLHWWPWKNNKIERWTGQEPFSHERAAARDRLIAMNREQVPVEQRIFGDAGYLRPNFIQPYRCRNVHIEGITILHSPMWIVHPVLCENVIVENLNISSHGPNSDGCDPESCRDVLIQNCNFDTGDDCIALKSGRNQDGRRINRPIENVIVRNCRMKDGHGGVVIGSEVSGGARNIFAEDCIMDSPNLDRAIRVKTNRSRGGIIENLYFRNITVGTVREAVIKVNMRYTLDDSISVSYPEVRNIYIEAVNARQSEYGILIMGIDSTHQVTQLVVKNCDLGNTEKGNHIEFAKDLQFSNLTLNGVPWEYQ